jgi:hypothetical protein
MRERLILALLLLLVLAAMAWWPLYKFRECLKVGHSAIYCVLDN